MTEDELNVNVRLSCQRALLGAITPNVRMITVGWDGLKNFRLRVYFENEASPEEIEVMEAVTSEIISDLPFEVVDSVEGVVLNETITNLPVFKCVVFARKEEY